MMTTNERGDDGKYRFSFEVAGELAGFNAPDALPNYITYPFPTLPACEGWIKHIETLNSARAVVERLEICAPLHYEKLDFLNTSFGRYTQNVEKRAANIIKRIVLRDVCYKIHCYTEVDGRFDQFRTNNKHVYQTILMRAIRSGLPRHAIFFGSSEYPVSYFGELREETQVETSLNLTVPRMLVRTFDTFKKGDFVGEMEPVEVLNGVVKYEDLYAVAS